MKYYSISGGAQTKGSIAISGNKNAALPCIAATLLTDEPVILKNIPNIEDVSVMLSIVKHIGYSYEEVAKNTIKIVPDNIKTSEIPSDLCRKIRASILFAAPLLARTGKAVFAPPGGDIIGRRRLDTHFLALAELGAHFSINRIFTVHAKKLTGAEIFLDEASVTATENAIMAAVLASGTTVIENAACEPHVQDLCTMLNNMGSDISGIGSNILTIQGKKKLYGCEFSIGADYMEVGSFIGLAAVTHGELELTHINPKDMKPLKKSFAKLGLHWQTEGNSIYVQKKQDLRVVPELGNQIPKIDDAPWPGFPADLISIALVMATQAKGTILIHEKLYESRMFFVDKLIAMGAQTILCDPHRAVVVGPSKLIADNLVSPDVRAGMAMLLAAVCAQGTSTIHNIYQIERGYENICERLRGVGIVINHEEE